MSEHALLDFPSSLATFYSDQNKPQTPCVAVAAGPYVFIYRNLRPYYKFTLPPVDVEPVEKVRALSCFSNWCVVMVTLGTLQDIWEALRVAKITTPEVKYRCVCATDADCALLLFDRVFVHSRRRATTACSSLPALRCELRLPGASC